MHFSKLLAFLSLAFFFQSCGTNRKALNTVSSVNLEKYSGTWYEIARFPNSFEKGLKCTTANYTIRKDGKIRVVNTGHRIENPKEVKTATGVAWVPDKEKPGELKVSFFWPFSGDYYIIDLEPDYQYALVGDPSRKYLWILSRSKKISEDIYNQLLLKATTNGFDTSKFMKVEQDCN